MIKWVLRGGRVVDTDPEVWVRFPSVAVEIDGLWGHNWAGGRAEREARRDERRPMSRHCGLAACLVSFVVAIVHSQGSGGALENLRPILGRDHGKGPGFNSR